MSDEKQRNSNGTFADGNLGGPGRPRRVVEADYLRALTEACSIEDWRQIVARAKADAKKGDAKAREWLAGFVVGSPQGVAPTLLSIAVQALAGADPIQRAVDREKQEEKLARIDRMLNRS